MTKEELKTIILKIQNECALEAPTKITYFWNEEEKLVFKLFFDSLYLPKVLDISDHEKIKNLFTTQNVYEFEDDFKILDLDTKEGFILVLPKDQNFKVVNTYKDLKDEEPGENEKEESVLLAGKKLNENFAKSWGMILQEGEEPKPAGEAEEQTAAVKDASDAERKKVAARAQKKNGDSFIIFAVPGFHSVQAWNAAFKAVESSKIDANKFEKINWTPFPVYGDKLDFADFRTSLDIAENAAFQFFNGKVDAKDGSWEGQLKTASSKNTKSVKLLQSDWVKNLQIGLDNIEGVDEGLLKAYNDAVSKGIKGFEALSDKFKNSVIKEYLETLKAAENEGVKKNEWYKYFSEKIKGFADAEKVRDTIKNHGKKNYYSEDWVKYAGMGVCEATYLSGDVAKIDEAWKKRAADEAKEKKKNGKGSAEDSDALSDSFDKGVEQAMKQTIASTGETADAGTVGEGGFGQIKTSMGKGAGTSFKDGSVQKKDNKPEPSGGGGEKSELPTDTIGQLILQALAMVHLNEWLGDAKTLFTTGTLDAATAKNVGEESSDDDEEEVDEFEDEEEEE